MGAVLAFLVPFVFADLLDVQQDVYYAIYAASVLALVLTWARSTGLRPAALLARRPVAAVVLGLAAAALLAAIAWSYDATPHPGGVELAGAIVWRGLVYGAADGLLLGAFPVLVVFTAIPFLRGRAHLARTLGTGALALLAALAITAVYHLGYADFRSSKLTAPMRGAVVWSAPTLLTLNPLGSVLAHAGLHVSAVVHSYEGDLFLPPHAEAASPTIALRPCTVGATRALCGTLEVAENPNEPEGAQIPLDVAVVEAQSAHPKPDPLFWFAGWGGAGVADDAAGAVGAFVRVNRDRDLVFVDQRGTGSSELRCRAPNLSAATPAGLRRVTEAASRCAARIGPNLRFYTSAVAVDDVDRVREALGYDRINLYGGSYGVTTGQVYLLRHESHVRSAVFDSGSLLDVRIFERGAPNAERALELLFARCAADAGCHAAYPELRAEYEAILARLERGPLPIPGTDVELTPVTFAVALDEQLAWTPTKRGVPRLIHLVATGRLAEAAADYSAATSPSEDLAYKLLIQCSEPWASRRPDETARLSRGTFMRPLQELSAAALGAACEGFPPGVVPASLGERVDSDVPVLFLNGNEDPADPPGNVADARRELPNSRTVVFPGAGHGQLGLSCAQNLITEFLRRGSATGLDTSCARTAVLQPFDTRG
ncbi:MAG TPA: alpha/beta hydrolase [Gaiellaceae bacterium]|nr:alpha/beta hydrolase [Gaiellaceae bacterium]